MSSNNHNTYSPVRATTRGVIPGGAPHFEDFLGSRHIENVSRHAGTIDLQTEDELFDGNRNEAYLRGLAQAAETDHTQNTVQDESSSKQEIDPSELAHEQEAERRSADAREIITRAPIQLVTMREYAKAHYTREDVALAA